MQKPTIPTSCLAEITLDEARMLVKRGYVSRGPLFDEAFADAFAAEVDRLIDQGLIPPAPDRIVNGVATEWIVNFGLVIERGLDAEIFAKSPLLLELFTSAQAFGDSVNRMRAVMMENGDEDAKEVPELGSEGVEMNVNRVVGTPAAVWSGLHLHRDDTRFTNGLQALDRSSIAHQAVMARALTLSGYARRRDESGAPRDDIGGALPFLIRDGAKNPGDRAVFDVLPARHNSGAFFFPATVHGVGRMTEGGIRYSFQAFFPRAAAWRKIRQRLARRD